MKGDPLLEYDMVVTETPKSWLLLMTWVDNNFTMWMPKNCCKLHEDDNMVQLPMWLMRAKADEHKIQEFYDILNGDQS